MGLTERTDEEVAALVQRGDVEAFGTLVGRYEEKMLRYARRFLLESDDAKDLVQDVFIKAYTNIRGFDATRRFSPWLYRIAHNEFINALKKRRGRETVSLFYFDIFLPHPMAEETADSGANRAEVRRLIGSSLDKLGPKYREPLVLYYFQDMSYQEIAEILQVPTSTVGVRLRRGRALLKNIVEPLPQP